MPPESLPEVAKLTSMAFGGKTVGSPNRPGEMTKLSSGAWAGDARQEGRVVYQKVSHSHANDRA